MANPAAQTARSAPVLCALLGWTILSDVFASPGHALMITGFVRVHACKILLWTLGARLLTHAIVGHIHVGAVMAAHRLPLLLLACLVGVIPVSGPHLVFVTLYAQSALPLSVLLAICVVQDGHGMLPLLARSREAFAAVKVLKFLFGLAVGLLGYAMGW